MVAYFAKSERCKDILYSQNSGNAPSQNTIFSPVSDELIAFGGAYDVIDADADADADADSGGNYLFLLGELLDPVFKD